MSYLSLTAFALKCYESKITNSSGTPVINDTAIGIVECPSQHICLLINATLAGDVVSYHFQVQCSVESVCRLGENNQLCFTMSPENTINCDFSCCQDDLCNKPPDFTPTPGGTTPKPLTVKSSARKPSVPPHAAIFGVLAIIGVVLVDMF